MLHRVMCNLCDPGSVVVGERKTVRGARALQKRHRSSRPHRAALRRYDNESVRILSPV